MQRVSRDQFITTFSRDHPPVLEVDPGAELLVETHDCYGGYSRDERPPGLGNPATGPIAIRGARPGQVLEVDILDIVPGPRGFVGAEGVTKYIELVDGRARFSEGLTLPLQPMVGVIGVAPADGAPPCTYPGDHGGNLDTIDVCAGATVCLPVQVEGALLALGDVHACQGDGEVSGQGIEVAAEVTLGVRLGEVPLSRRPYILRDGRLLTIASGATLEEAVQASVEDMVAVLGAQLGLPGPEARMLVSLAGHVRISQIVNPLLTARVEMPVLW